MTQATFSTPSVSCMSCMAKIERVLTPLDGVAEVEVDVNVGQVTVTYDESRVASERLAEAISEAGYEATALSR